MLYPKCDVFILSSMSWCHGVSYYPRIIEYFRFIASNLKYRLTDCTGMKSKQCNVRISFTLGWKLYRPKLKGLVTNKKTLCRLKIKKKSHAAFWNLIKSKGRTIIVGQPKRQTIEASFMLLPDGSTAVWFRPLWLVFPWCVSVQH